MGSAARVLVLNNYPLDEVWGEVKRGGKPDHHLYGINHFPSLGYEVDILRESDLAELPRWAGLLGKALRPIPMGDLAHQWNAWPRLKKCDLVYAPCGDQTQVLGYLRAFGLLRVPLVALIHHPLNVGRLRVAREPWARLMIRGHDALPTLSSAVADEINAKCRSARNGDKAFPVRWGPDLTFYPRTRRGGGEGFIAAGRTGRDFVTFGLAASQVAHPAEIICLDYDVRPEFASFARHVRVSVGSSRRVPSYPDFLQRMAQCRAIAIPLHRGIGLSGLTSLMDALAIGRPVIMTRNRFVDLDIEALGIGRWVEPGDVHGWRDAMTWFADHPEESAAMGERGRLLAEREVNSAEFASQMSACFQKVLRGPDHCLKSSV